MASDTGTPPLVLFDGVCNLCNAAVRWLLERDPRGRLRFASLQSKAASAALADTGVADPGTLPDSIVLVDEAGVHVRSAAALRIARHLGFPWSLLAVGLALPRPLRDAVYQWVARHRYRWFGRRDTCTRPTPELAVRFLDADEPAPVVQRGGSEPDPTGEVGERVAIGGWMSSWLRRLVVVYLVLYMLPFPFSLLGYLLRLPLVGDVPGLAPAIGWLAGLAGAAMNPLVTWVGAHVFGVEAVPQVTGSGDQTFNYVHLAVTAGLAVILASGWTAVTRGRAMGDRMFDAARTLARYYLATTLLTYGWIKTFPLQFPMPGPDRLLQPYGDSSPMGLAWTFFGASVAYQVFAGLSELVGGYLLLWRRTALAGALFGAAVMANVMAINFFYDVPVKLFSTHLLLVALFVMAPDLPRLVGFLGFNLPVAPRRDEPFWRGWTSRRGAVMALHLLFVVGLTAVHVSGNLQGARSYGFLREPSPLTGVYQVTAFEHGGLRDRANEDFRRWVRVGINAPGYTTIMRANGYAARMRMAVDEEARTVSFYDRGAQPPDDPQFTFERSPEGEVRLTGRFEGEPTTVVLTPTPVSPLLTERGYHWINEYPYNR